MFSLVPRCQGERGPAKYTVMPVSILNWACADNSLPRSQVNERSNSACIDSIVACSASFIATTP